MRYIDPKNDKQLCDPELLKHWLPVDLYVGGPEHAVGHLMYSRIWNRFLYDEGISPVKEPFQKLVHQGMILGENGIKMGKRFPEFVVNPSDVVRDYGADTLRLYEMFMGPLEVSKPWSTTGVVGAKKFINRVWNFFTEPANITEDNDGKLTKIYHQTVKRSTRTAPAPESTPRASSRCSPALPPMWARKCGSSWVTTRPSPMSPGLLMTKPSARMPR